MSTKNTKTQDRHIKNISIEDTMTEDIIRIEALNTQWHWKHKDRRYDGFMT
jgi:hypothetical protein